MGSKATGILIYIFSSYIFSLAAVHCVLDNTLSKFSHLCDLFIVELSETLSWKRISHAHEGEPISSLCVWDHAQAEVPIR